jgi:N-acetylmuramic acid 6-phosphate etherase
MVRVGKVFGNRMVDVRPISRKLRDRATRLIMELGGVPRARAQHLLRQAGGRTKLAIVMAAHRLTARAAHRLLAKHHDLLRPLLQNSP